jgi:hypothetical protein
MFAHRVVVSSYSAAAAGRAAIAVSKIRCGVAGMSMWVTP